MTLCWHRLPGRRILISGRWTVFFLFFSLLTLMISSDTYVLTISNQSKSFHLQMQVQIWRRPYDA